MAKPWAGMTERERAQCRTRGIVPLDYPDPVAADWPDLLEIVERLVKPERDAQGRRLGRSVGGSLRRKAMGLRAAVVGLERVIVISIGDPAPCCPDIDQVRSSATSSR